MKSLIKQRRLTIVVTTIALLTATLAFNSTTLGAFVINLVSNQNTSGLVGHWTFDGSDVSGTTVTDASGQGNSGTTVGGPVSAIGVLGQGMRFDGTDDFLTLSSESVTSLDAFTISGFLQADALSTDSVIYVEYNENVMIYVDRAYESISINAKREYDTTHATANSSNYFLADYNTNVLHFTAVFENDEWSIYVNGINDTQTSTAGTGTKLGKGGDLDRFRIGSNYYSNELWKGLLDDIRIYNRALTPTEIYDLYSNGNYTSGSSTIDNLQRGLVGHWALDDGTGSSTAADLTPNGNNGTLTNMDTANDWVSGQVGSGALDFDGTDDYTELGNGPIVNTSSNFTVSTWVKTTMTTRSDIFVEKDTGSSQNIDLNINEAGTGYIALVYRYGSIRDINANVNINDGEWHHIAAQRDGATIRLFHNGTEVASRSDVAGTPTGLDYSRLGHSPWGDQFSGQIDDIRIYNRALSETEIAKLYNLRVTQDSGTNPLSHWTFDGKDTDTGSSISYDRGSADNNGTLNGGPTPIQGKIGQALTFDGSDDQITVASDSSLNISTSGEFSQFMWFKKTTDCGPDNEVFSSRFGSTDDDRTWWFGCRASTDELVLRFFDSTAADGNLDTGIVIDDGQWHHGGWVYDGTSGETRIYFDGQLIDTASITLSADMDVVRPLCIGNYGTTCTHSLYYYDGLIDDIRVYNRALSADQIWQLYQESGGIKQSTSFVDSLQKGLVGHWALDDGTGSGTADDLTPNGNDGTLTNMDTANDWVSGQIGSGALDFDDSNDYVTMGSVLDFDNTDPFSISVWFKRNAISNGRNTLVSKRLTSGTYRGYYLTLESDNTFRMMLTSNGTGDSIGIDSRTVTDTTDWHHGVVTYDGSSSAAGMKLYLDGVEDSTITEDSLVGTTITTAEFNLGARNNGSDLFGGILDDVRIYSRELSADEVKQLYRIRATEDSSTGPIGHWTFDGPDISGTTAKDISSGGNNGTLTNGPVPARGKMGQGLRFDGTDQCVFLPNSAASADATYTYSAWFKADTTHFTFLVSESNTGNNTPQAGIVFNNGVARAIWRSDNSALKTIDGTTNIDDGKWHHLVATGDGTDMRLYVDGAQDGSSLGIDGTMTLNAGAIGCLNRPSIGSYADGIIDDARIYDRTLSATEVEDLYLQGR